MITRLMVTLLLGMILSAVPLAIACAGDGDDQGEDDDGQGGIVIRCPPGGCIQ